jgi:hypothetical protein
MFTSSWFKGFSYFDALYAFCVRREAGNVANKKYDNGEACALLNVKGKNLCWSKIVVNTSYYIDRYYAL